MDTKIYPTKAKRIRRTKRQIKNDEAKKESAKNNHKFITQETKLSNEIKNKSPLFKMSKYITVGRIEDVIRNITKSPSGLIIHEYFLKTFCKLDVSCIVSFLLYMENELTSYDSKDRWFVTKYKTIKQYTGIKHNRIFSIIKELRASGILETKKKGVPAMQHYKIDKDVLMDILYLSNPPKGFKDPIDSILKEIQINK